MPGPRYEGWMLLQLAGDQQTALKYVPFARKLLGYLADLRRLSGVPSQKIQRQLPDGAIITAQFVIDQPLVQIIPPENNLSENVADGIKGFLITPEGVLGDNPQTVLTPVGATWPARVFDTTYQPDPRPEASGIYARTSQGRSFFPAPDGLKEFANIDWRDDAETWVVSWLGPECRYFGSRRIGTKVYHHGQVLLDTTNPDVIELMGLDLLGGTIDSAGVEGAAVRDGYLYVVLSWRLSTTQTYYLARFPLSPNPFDPSLPRSANLAEEPRLKVGVGEILDSRTFAVGFVDDAYGAGIHPWFFNSAGTIAKRLVLHDITAEGRQYVAEHTWDLSTIDAIVFDEQLYDTGWRTFTDEFSDLTATAAIHIGTYEDIDWSSWSYGALAEGEYDISTMKTSGNLYEIGSTFISDFPLVEVNGTYTRQQTADVARYPIGVDWRDGEAVYAYAIPDTYQDDRTYSLGGAVYSQNSVFTAITGRIEVDEFFGTRTVDWVFADAVTTYERQLTIDKVRAQSEQRGFQLGEAAPVLAQSSVNETYNLSVDELRVREHTVVDPSVGGPTDDRLYDNSDLSASTEASYHKTEVAETLVVWWMDLRTNFVSYTKTRVTTQRDWTTAPPTNLAVSASSNSAVAYDLPRTLAETVTTERITSVVLDGLVLGTTTATTSTTTGSSDTYPVDGWPARVDNELMELLIPFDDQPVPIFEWTPGTPSYPLERVTWDTAPLVAVQALPNASRPDTASYTGEDPSPGSTTNLIGMDTPSTPSALTGALGSWIFTLKDGQRWYGGWQTFGGDWLFSQPWPTGGSPTTPNWINLSSAGTSDVLTQIARPTTDYVYPLTVISPAVIPLS